MAQPLTAWPHTFPLTREKFLTKARRKGWEKGIPREIYLGEHGMFGLKAKMEMGSENDDSFRVLSLEFSLIQCPTVPGEKG